MWREVITLIRKDITLDFRQRYAVFATLLYVVSTTYISYLAFRGLSDRMTWIALYWIITVFAGITTASRSFSAEPAGRFWYYAQLARPASIVLAKMIYNAVMLVIIALFTYFLLSLLLGNPIAGNGQMIMVIVLGAVGFSTILTLVSAIAAKTNNNATLMTVLSIPLLLPLTVTLLSASSNAALGLPWIENVSLLVVLALLTVLTGILSFVLFPYLWRD